MEHALLSLALVIVLGVSAQWLAWRTKLPSILLLVFFGFLAGPVFGLIKPDELLGEALMPFISLAVAIVLFEGGLSLRFAELRDGGGQVWRLVSVGSLITWLGAASAARLLGGLEWPLAVLFGAIVVVTGPTVVKPMLRHVQPKRPLGSMLKWEGILSDPLGASLAVIVFEVISLEHGGVWTSVIEGVGLTLAAGLVLGLAGAVLVVAPLHRNWVPDFLHSPVALMVAVGVFTTSNMIQHESGLLAVTVMGVAMANQRYASVHHIIEFKENLQVLLIATLFILLAARFRMAELLDVGLASLAVLVALIVLVRPAAVIVSMFGSGLTLPQKGFLMTVAPRGIVAAAVVSVFVLRLEGMGVEQAQQLKLLTFVAVVGTIAVYGISAGPVARWLNVGGHSAEGVLFVGAHSWARKLAEALREHEVPVLLVDTNYDNIRAARLEGLPAQHINVLDRDALDRMDLAGIGKLLAVTPNDQVNALVCVHFSYEFGRSNVYQLNSHTAEKTKAPSETKAAPSGEQARPELRGRDLFADRASYAFLSGFFNRGAQVRSTRITDDFTFADFREHHGDKAVPMFILSNDGGLTVVGPGFEGTRRPAYTLVAAVPGEQSKDRPGENNAPRES